MWYLERSKTNHPMYKGKSKRIHSLRWMSLLRCQSRLGNMDRKHGALYCTEKTMLPFPFTMNWIWSWWQFSFRFRTKWKSIWFKIERKTVNTIISHSIWKEIKYEFLQCSWLRYFPYSYVTYAGSIYPTYYSYHYLLFYLQ